MFRATRKTLNEVPSLDASTSSLMLQKKGSKSSPATAVPNPGRHFLMSVRSSERMKDKTIRSASPEASRQSHIPVLVRGWIKDSEATRFPTITCGNGSASTLLSIYSISKYAVRFDDSIYDEPSLAFFGGSGRRSCTAASTKAALTSKRRATHASPIPQRTARSSLLAENLAIVG